MSDRRTNGALAHSTFSIYQMLIGLMRFIRTSNAVAVPSTTETMVRVPGDVQPGPSGFIPMSVETRQATPMPEGQEPLPQDAPTIIQEPLPPPVPQAQVPDRHAMGQIIDLAVNLANWRMEQNPQAAAAMLPTTQNAMPEEIRGLFAAVMPNGSVIPAFMAHLAWLVLYFASWANPRAQPGNRRRREQHQHRRYRERRDSTSSESSQSDRENHPRRSRHAARQREEYRMNARRHQQVMAAVNNRPPNHVQTLVTIHAPLNVQTISSSSQAHNANTNLQGLMTQGFDLDARSHTVDPQQDAAEAASQWAEEDPDDVNIQILEN